MSEQLLTLENADAPGNPDPGMTPSSTPGDTDWKSGLSEDMRNHGDIKAAKSVEDLVGRYIGNREKMSRMINIPSHEAGEQEKAEFYQKLAEIDGVTRIPSNDDKEGWKNLYRSIGVPDTPEAYDIEDAEVAKSLHALDLNGGQAEAVARMLSEAKTTMADQLKATAEEGLANLKGEWGEKWEHNVKAAAMAFKEFGGEEIFEFLAESGLSGRAEMLQMGLNLSQKLRAEKLPIGDTTARHGMTKAEAQAAIDSIYANLSDPYHDKGHPDHEKRTATMNKYFDIVSGG